MAMLNQRVTYFECWMGFPVGWCWILSNISRSRLAPCVFTNMLLKNLDKLEGPCFFLQLPLSSSENQPWMMSSFRSFSEFMQKLSGHFSFCGRWKIYPGSWWKFFDPYMLHNPQSHTLMPMATIQVALSSQHLAKSRLDDLGTAAGAYASALGFQVTAVCQASISDQCELSGSWFQPSEKY